MLPKRIIARALVLIAATATATLGFVAPASAAPVPVNSTIELHNGSTRQCMEAENSHYITGTDVQQWPCVGQGGRLWYTEYVSLDNAGYFRLRVAGARELCATPVATYNGGQVDLQLCMDTDIIEGRAQLWYYESPNNAVAYIHSYYSGPTRCLEVNNGDTAPGLNVQFWECDDKAWQYWWGQ